MIRKLGLICLLAAQALAFDWDKIDRLLCAELRKGTDQKTAAVKVCKEVTKSLPFLQGQCEALVSKTMAALDKKCDAILPTTTTTTEAPAMSVLGDQLLSLFHGKFEDVSVDKIATSAVDLLPSDVKEAAEKAGLPMPTPHDLMCKGMTDAILENRTQTAVCQILLPEGGSEAVVKALEACYKAVDFVWGQEAASLKCKGAPKPWWPFAVLHGVADELICYQLKNGDLHDKEQGVTGKICDKISGSPMEQFSCEAALKQFFQGYEQKCAESEHGDVLDILKELPKELPKDADILV